MNQLLVNFEATALIERVLEFNPFKTVDNVITSLNDYKRNGQALMSSEIFMKYFPVIFSKGTEKQKQILIERIELLMMVSPVNLKLKWKKVISENIL